MSIISISVRIFTVICFISATSIPTIAQDYWEKLASPPSAHPGPLSVSKILITKQGTYLCATSEGSGVYRSVNRGTSWITSTPYVNYDHGITYCVNLTGDIFVVTNNANGGNEITKIGRSTDDGVSYKNQPAYPSNKTVNSMICTSTGTLFIGTNRDGIYRSTDDAASWQHIEFKAITDSSTTCLLDGDNGIIYAGTNADGIYQSKNNGDTWTPLYYNITLSNIKSLAKDKNGYLYAGSNYGAYRSKDAGITWEEIFSSGSSGSTAVSDIIVTSQGRIYLTMLGNGTYCSIDNGKSWTQLITGFKSNNVNTIAVDSTGNFLVGTSLDMYRNTNAPVLNASIDINNQEINFGDLTYPEQKDSIITITNIGNSMLEVSNMSINGISAASFQITPSSAFSLSSGQSKQITIHCKPNKNGDLEANLKFTSNSAGETSEIRLLGFSSGVNGINEMEDFPFTGNLSPNPSVGNGIFTLTSEKISNGTFSIFNMLGISVFSREFTIMSNASLVLHWNIPFSNSSGLYQGICTIGHQSVSIPISVIR